MHSITARYMGDARNAPSGWHQGWNDRINADYVAQYETNLAIVGLMSSTSPPTAGK